jgi:2,3-bisphosphoglycerate-independent phosphoglycerate mutase
MGHVGKTDLKIKAIEDLDRRLLGRLLGRIGEGFRILLMPDHPTPIRIKTHSGGPVPFALWGSGIEPNHSAPGGAGGRSERGFSERDAEATGLFVREGHEIINLLFRGR